MVDKLSDKPSAGGTAGTTGMSQQGGMSQQSGSKPQEAKPQEAKPSESKFEFTKPGELVKPKPGLEPPAAESMKAIRHHVDNLKRTDEELWTLFDSTIRAAERRFPDKLKEGKEGNNDKSKAA